jgi:hypothetical protein
MAQPGTLSMRGPNVELPRDTLALAALPPLCRFLAGTSLSQLSVKFGLNLVY